MEMREFLELIAAAKHGFKCPGLSLENLHDFQSIVALGKHAFELGYIDAFQPHQESYTGHRLCDAFLVGGVTDEGREFLSRR